MSSSSDFSAEQLSAARTTAWHQDGKALVTLESARSWVDHYGFVLFAPRAEQLGCPAPSFVEVTLGAVNAAPSVADSAIARGLVARLVAEGSVIPLNLLGSAGELPDFLASAKVFPYIFTMRGDKAWKQAPQTSGATKVSPLALRVYETLQEKGAMSASELASELGREVTETAISRALSELWAQLRVIPQLQQDENAATLWELLSARFSKAIKAGANAGQPSAMSALLSLYLAQAVASTEEEAAGFLSPLTARSRVREVVHALTAGRQLDATVVEGKTLLHVSGNLPEFAAAEKPEADPTEQAPEAEPTTYTPKKVGTGRIGKFASESKPRTDFKGKPARTFGGSESGPSRGPARKYGTGADRAYSPRPDANRRPFTRKDAGAAGKPSFTKPWEEDKRPRSTEGESDSGAAAPRERKSFSTKAAFGAKKPFGDRKPFGERKSFGGPKPFGDRKPFAPREGAAADSDRPRRSFGDKPNFGNKPAFGARPSYGDRPARARRDEGGAGFERRERPSYPPRDGGSPRERKSFGAPKAFGERKSFGGPKPFGAPKSFGDRKPFAPRREGGGEGFAPRERSAFPKREGFAPRSYERKPFPPREGAGGEDRPRRTFGDKPQSFGGPKPGGFSKFAKPESTGRSYGKPGYGGSDSKPRSTGAKPGGFGAGRPSFGGGKPAGKFGSRPPSKFGAKPAGGGKFGAKPGRPFTKRPGSDGPAFRKPEAEE